MAEHSGQKISQLSADTERDFFMGSEAAKDYGIIDDIVRRKPTDG
jgi:ATP-dependent Clp protease protease subunit